MKYFKIKEIFIFLIVSIFVFFSFAYTYEVFFVQRYIILNSPLLTGSEKAFYQKYLKALKNNQPYDTRGIWEFVDENNKETQNPSQLIYPWFGYYWLKTDFPGHDPGNHIYNSGSILNFKSVVPFSGPSLTKIVTANEGGLYGVNYLDEFGFNNPLGLYNKGLEIAVVGDSFAEGMSTNSNEDVVSFIRETYPESINLAKAGAGPLTSLAITREYVEVLKPKKVLWIFYEGNDMFDLTRETSDIKQVGNFLKNYIDSEFKQDLFFKQSEIDEYLVEVFWPNFYFSKRAFPDGDSDLYGTPLNRSVNVALRKIEQMDKIPLIDRLKLKNTFKAINNTFIPAFTSSWQTLPKKLINNNEPELYLKDDNDWGLFSQILATANHSIEDYGGELIFIYLPQYERVKNNDAKTFISPYGIHSEDKKKVIKIIKDLNIKLIDTTDDLIKHKDPMSLYFFRQDGHFNKKGNKYLAQIILNNMN